MYRTERLLYTVYRTAEAENSLVENDWANKNKF